MTVAQLIQELRKCPEGAKVRSYNQCTSCGNIVAEDVADIKQRILSGTHKQYVFLFGALYRSKRPI